MITEASQLDNYNIQSAAAFDEATRRGMQVILPEPNQLFIDIDSEAAFDLFLAQIERLRQYEFAHWSSTQSSSGYPNRHIVVEVGRDLSDTERVAFQAAMGSDPIRELLGLIRISHGDPHPTLFLENKCATPATVRENSATDSKTTKVTRPSTDSSTTDSL